MTLPAESPAVVILDVLNLRRYTKAEEREPFRIQDFDSCVAAISQRLPSFIMIGIVDGTAAKFKSKVFASREDHAELIRRSNLPPVDPQHLYLLPKRQDKWGWGTDLKYIKADPVCVHLLSKFSDNGAIVSGDKFDKSEDFAWFPPNHALRANLFVPFWLRRRREWIFLARAQVQRKWDEEFWDDVEDGKFLQLEQFLNSSPISEDEFAAVRQQAYAYVHDVVYEHRAAGTRVVPIVLDWQKSSSNHDLDPAMFPAAPDTPIELAEDGPIRVSRPDDSIVLVRVDTEQIDLIRSIDELQVYTGKRIAVQAMLQIDGEIPYLTWLGRSSRVKVTLWSASAVIKSGFVRLEGVLTSDDGELTISVASANDLRYPSVGDAVSARLARLVKRDIYVGSKGSWTFPRLPRRPSRQSPPTTTPGVIDEPDTPIGDGAGRGPRIAQTDAGSDVKRGSAKTTVQTGGSDSETTKGRSGTKPSDVKPDTDQPARRTKWRMLAWIATACLVAAAVWFVLQTYVFAFEIPDPAVCANLEPEVCEAIIAEWQGDALRIHLYGTRDADGVVR